MASSTIEWESQPCRKFPGEWIVEGIDYANDGIIHMVRFCGPDAERMATEYAAWKNGSLSPAA